MVEEDWQSQVDELVALQAILEDALRLSDGQKLTNEAAEALRDRPPAMAGLAFSIACLLELPESGVELRALSSSSEELEILGRLQHLPPLLLTLCFPPDYPSKSPPGLSLAAAWLQSHQSTALREALLRQWAEGGGGQPICFTWVDWLQREALEALGSLSTLDLVERRAERGAEGQSSSAGSSEGVADGEGGEVLEQLVFQLLQYDARRKRQLFWEGTWPCGICFEEVPGRQCLHPAPCSHYYCATCVHGLCKSALEEAAVERLCCPDVGCRAPFVRERVAHLLAEEEVERWEAVELERALAKMGDATFCPRCSTACIGEEGVGQCPRCFYVFCTRCKASYHPGERCSTAEVELAKLHHQLSTSSSLQHREELKRKKQELQSLYTIEKSSKACPTCNMAISKTEGCNKMVCTTCGTSFCWMCGQAVRGYGHFGEASCALFDAEALAAWELQMLHPDLRAARERHALQERMQGYEHKDRLPCPQCKAQNMKTAGNNHMFCYNCGVHFCFLCKALLKGTKGHFNRAHPQHS